MTFTESAEFYPTFEDFMSEDKLPPVFPSSQSSNVSENQVYSQHLISEVCDRETYGPFGIGTTDDDEMPFSLINSSVAYSPESIPPRSPLDDSSPLNITSASSSTFEPMDIAMGETNELLEALPNGNESIEEILNIDKLPILENDELEAMLADITEISAKEFAFDVNLLPSPATSPSPSATPVSTIFIETPSVSSCIKFEATSSDSNLSKSYSTNQSTTTNDSGVKKPATRGRKRKLFTNCEEKKKDQNKEAARRYREKKKQEDAVLEAEEAKLKEEQKNLRRELELLTAAHRELLNTMKDFLQVKRKRQ